MSIQVYSLIHTLSVALIISLDKETVFKLNEQASSSYQNIDYTTDLISINANEFYAVVEAIEKAKGETVAPLDRLKA